MTETLYTINHLVLITGLTDRTIRNYIHRGLLEGEMINGLWHFTPEQVEAFIYHPAVRPSIQAKQNAVVYDFLLNDKKPESQMCTVLDLPNNDPKEISNFFCYEISNNSAFYDLNFCFSNIHGIPRVILKGPSAQIMALLQVFFQKTQVQGN